jgi:hypothetical protein
MATRQDDKQEFEEGTNERVSLDTPSKFTLTRFRKSKWTQLFFLVLTYLSWTR